MPPTWIGIVASLVGTAVILRGICEKAESLVITSCGDHKRTQLSHIWCPDCGPRGHSLRSLKCPPKPTTLIAFHILGMSDAQLVAPPAAVTLSSDRGEAKLLEADEPKFELQRQVKPILTLLLWMLSPDAPIPAQRTLSEETGLVP
jgi:hypothetical protein